MIRGCVVLLSVGVVFVTLDLVERTIVAAVIKLRPRARARVLRRWVAFCAGAVSRLLRHVGGVNLDRLDPLPATPGTLVIMNHQSLLDIVVMYEMFEGGYPRMVTRRRYAHGIPLVSHNLVLCDHPLVDPGEPIEPQIDMLREFGRTSTTPVAIFPEGHRTRDGEISPFRTAGLKALLTARPWMVYVVVGDGMWRCARLRDFIREFSSVHARVERLGPFEFSGSEEEADEFIARVHRLMREKLGEMRSVSRDERDVP